jgi:hypothetical protein
MYSRWRIMPDFSEDNLLPQLGDEGEVLGSVAQSEPVDWCRSKLQPHLSLPLIVVLYLEPGLARHVVMPRWSFEPFYSIYT